MSYKRFDLSACFAPGQPSEGRRFLVQEPGLTIVYLTLEPGGAMPLHNHPGANVAIQCMVGEATVLLDGVPHKLKEQELLCFPGELMVSPRNESGSPVGVLITLAEVTEPTPRTP